MHDTLPLLRNTDFPQIQRSKLETLQVNLGYKCNQSCLHCHVNAGPKRTEEMSLDTIEQVLVFLKIRTLKNWMLLVALQNLIHTLNTWLKKRTSWVLILLIVAT